MAITHRLRIGLAAIVAAAWLPATAQAQLTAVPYLSGLDAPVSFVQDPTDPTVQFIVQQRGLIRTVKSGVLQSTPFLDLTAVVSSGPANGLLDLAFPPDAAASGRLYVSFTRPIGDFDHSVVARFKRSANPLIVDPASRLDFRWSTGLRYIEQPFTSHDGGCMAFGPDGYLYISRGDGGLGNDPEHNAQNLTLLLGKMLRIDVNVPETNLDGFTVPATNPHLGAGSRPEIWSVGLRNPWKFSFDPVAVGGAGGMFVADVGQKGWEEIDYEPPGQGGRNYGWRNREGAHDNITSLPPAFLPLVDPIFEYSHDDGESITGGYLYRGRISGARGRYFFADFIRGRVWSVKITLGPGAAASAGDLIEHTTELGGPSTLGNISAFGIDAAGELYIINYAAGTVLRVSQRVKAPTNLRIIR